MIEGGGMIERGERERERETHLLDRDVHEQVRSLDRDCLVA